MFLITFRYCEVEVTQYDETGSVEGCDEVISGGRLVEVDALLPQVVISEPHVLLWLVNIVERPRVEGHQLKRDLHT